MTLEEQSNIFCIFHDGYIRRFNRIGNDVEFIVQIEYLARLINPKFTTFKVILKNCNRLEYEVISDRLIVINDFSLLDVLNLEIAYAREDKNCIKVESYSKTECYGGYLIISADDIVVFDESNHILSIDKLDEICNLYWNNEKSY